MVEVAGTLDAPRVLARRRVVIADAELRGSKQPYHAAAELPVAKAGALVQAAIESSRGLALEAFSAALRPLRAKGHEIAGCGIVAGSGRTLPGLEAILASHALIHTAEGEMFREALIWAAQQCGLRVAALREKAIEPGPLEKIASLGKLIGPPWTLDQKFAALAALGVLTES
jgi:hypothetical protein